ncbi:MAG: oligosaccharide deacetylase, partial [Clostridiales bacterium]|nr:oligosaccharide deacetylase [Clostridiales bacterium]MDY4134396.1 oligosaccharide deacetylase [Terrisporobacter sp.]
DTQEAVKSVTGVYPKTFRPPYRAISRDMCEIVKQKDMNIVLWSYVDARDWSSPGVNSIIKTIEDGIKNGCIILLHDYNKLRTPKSQTIEALDIIIPDLLQKGYKFVTISELIDHLEVNTNN